MITRNVNWGRMVWLGSVVLVMLVAPKQPNAVDVTRSFASPSLRHLAGTDRLGRDVLSRNAHALRATVIHVGTAAGIGLSLALAFAAFGSRLATERRLVSVFLEATTLALRMVPPLLLAFTIAVLFRGSRSVLVGSLALLSFSFAAPVFTAELQSAARLPQLQAATVLGARRGWTLRHYVLPIIGPRIGRYALLDTMSLAAFEALFGFFGLTDPSVPSLGGMIAEARYYAFDRPWLLLAPAGTLMLLLAGAWQASVPTDWS